MGITTKGQVTIPQEIRNKLGLLPYTRVEFQIIGEVVQIRKAKEQVSSSTRGQAVLNALRGTADSGLSTKEIMAMTRGEE